MHLFFLAAGVLLLTAFLLTYAARRRDQPPAEPKEAEPGLSDQEAAAAAQALGAAVEPLRELMAHPELGGPGFLTVQFPAGGCSTVSAQYPNINEALYRRAVRQELDREELLAAGVPEALLRLEPAFTAEGGGVVMAAVEVPFLGQAADLAASRCARDRTLSALAAALERRYPELSVRRLGADLLLTPQGRAG